VPSSYAFRANEDMRPGSARVEPPPARNGLYDRAHDPQKSADFWKRSCVISKRIELDPIQLEIIALQ